MAFPAVFTAFGAVCLFIFLKYRVKGCTVETTLIKAVTSFFFLASAASSISTFGDGSDRIVYGMFILCGLFFGLLGDIWLDLKYVHPNDEMPYTYAGFIVFGIGHFFYDGAMLMRFYIPGKPACIVLPLVGSAAAAVFVSISEGILGVNYGKYRRISIGYGAVLASFVFFSLALAVLYRFKEPVLNLMNIAAVLFFLSDLVLNKIYFGKDQNKPANVTVNFLTYYAAQFLIAFSLSLL